MPGVFYRRGRGATSATSTPERGQPARCSLAEPRWPLSQGEQVLDSLDSDAVQCRLQGPAPFEDAIEHTRRQVETLDEACRNAGRDPRSIRRTILAFRVRPPVFASVDRFREVAGRYRELGIKEFYLPWPAPSAAAREQEAVMERVAREVIPELRAERAAPS